MLAVIVVISAYIQIISQLEVFTCQPLCNWKWFWAVIGGVKFFWEKLVEVVKKFWVLRGIELAIVLHFDMIVDNADIVIISRPFHSVGYLYVKFLIIF